MSFGYYLTTHTISAQALFIYTSQSPYSNGVPFGDKGEAYWLLWSRDSPATKGAGVSIYKYLIKCPPSVVMNHWRYGKEPQLCTKHPKLEQVHSYAGNEGAQHDQTRSRQTEWLYGTERKVGLHYPLSPGTSHMSRIFLGFSETMKSFQKISPSAHYFHKHILNIS